MKIGIISSIGHQTYQGKYLSRKANWSTFWDLAIFHQDLPIDVIDYYNLKKDASYNVSLEKDRHIYTNGILLANRLKDVSNDISVHNSVDNFDDLVSYELVIVSTNYIYNEWENVLISLLEYLKTKNIKCIIGGIGIKKLANNKSLTFEKINKLIDGYIVISDNGLTCLKWAIQNIAVITNKVIFWEDHYDINPNDFSLKDLSIELHSQHTTFLTQTGCPFNCSFCSYKAKYKHHTFFDFNFTTLALLELISSNKKGLRHIRFVDETFNVDTKRAIELCNFIISNNLEFSWSCFLRADNITSELVESLQKANCNLVSIGVESGSSYMQKIMNKNINLERLRESILLLQQYNIKVNISLLVGFLGESNNTIDETIDYIKITKPDLVRINTWSPSINSKNIKLFNEFDFKINNGTWSHKTMCEQEAIENAKKIYLEDMSTVCLPPFSSVFDQWPVFVSFDLSAISIIEIFKEYYSISKLQYNKKKI